VSSGKGFKTASSTLPQRALVRHSLPIVAVAADGQH
jgi:hypothetical protein